MAKGLENAVKAGWEEVRVGDVLKLEYGKPLPKERRSDSGKYEVYGANGIKAYSDEFYANGPSIIVGRKGSAGEINLVRSNFWPLDVTYFTVHDKNRIDFGFLHYILGSLNLPSMARGVKPGINRNDVYALEIPLPPLEEQKRIVAVLDGAFEALTRARAHVEANLLNARELFEAQRKNTLSQAKSNWETLSLDAVCKVDRGSSPRPIKSFLTTDDEGVNWIKIGDTQVGSKYVRSTKQRITREGAKKSRRVEIGDFILTNSMTYGRPYIMGIDGYIHDGWFVLRLNKNIQSDFFFHLLSSAVVQEQFEALAVGAVVKNISGDLVKKTVLQIPPISEQVEIASALDLAASNGELLEAIYQTKLTDLENLRQSLLLKVFSGELT